MDTTRCKDCGHKLNAHYAVANAPPQGIALPGEHVACKGCDDASGSCALQRHSDTAWAYYFPDPAERAAARAHAAGRDALEMFAAAVEALPAGVSPTGARLVMTAA